jgi:hypothetical protein
MVVSAKDILWEERIAQWYESGLTQSAYAKQIGVAQKSISYWAHKLDGRQAPLANPALPALLPVQVIIPPAAAPVEMTPAITLHSERGWTLKLPGNVSAGWLADLMRGL